MKDVHKTLARRSMKDAMYVYEDVVEDDSGGSDQ